jgi:hypothetical protein
MWWRVTGLALVMCGASPEHIGAAGWEEHPTLRALIKMVTSDRYRFPTVDCDDIAREEMKKTEQTMRDEVRAYCISPIYFRCRLCSFVLVLLPSEGSSSDRTPFPSQKVQKKEV